MHKFLHFYFGIFLHFYVRMVTKNNWNDKSYILDIKYRQNTKLRLWEMLLIHNQAITIPEEMCMSRMV